jgi:hypothetical protein
MLSIPAKSNLYEHLLSRSGQMMADDGRWWQDAQNIIKLAQNYNYLEKKTPICQSEDISLNSNVWGLKWFPD